MRHNVYIKRRSLLGSSTNTSYLPWWYGRKIVHLVRPIKDGSVEPFHGGQRRPAHDTIASTRELQCYEMDTTMTGTTMTYSKAARDVAVERVHAFLEKHLK